MRESRHTKRIRSSYFQLKTASGWQLTLPTCSSLNLSGTIIRQTSEAWRPKTLVGAISIYVRGRREAFHTTATDMEFIEAALDALKVQPMTRCYFVNFVGKEEEMIGINVRELVLWKSVLVSTIGEIMDRAWRSTKGGLNTAYLPGWPLVWWFFIAS
jgi:hypothetical protein